MLSEGDTISNLLAISNHRNCSNFFDFSLNVRKHIIVELDFTIRSGVMKQNKFNKEAIFTDNVAEVLCANIASHNVFRHCVIVLNLPTYFYTLGGSTAILAQPLQFLNYRELVLWSSQEH